MSSAYPKRGDLPSFYCCAITLSAAELGFRQKISDFRMENGSDSRYTGRMVTQEQAQSICRDSPWDKERVVVQAERRPWSGTHFFARLGPKGILLVIFAGRDPTEAPGASVKFGNSRFFRTWKGVVRVHDFCAIYEPEESLTESDRLRLYAELMEEMI